MPEQTNPKENESRNNLGPHQVRMESWMELAPFESLLGIEISKAADGKAELRMPFIRDLAQGFGLMHGGALTSLADTSVVMAIKSLLPPASRFATIRIEVDFLKPVTNGYVTARAGITRCLDRDLYCVSEIVDDSGDPVLNCQCQFRVARDVPMDTLPGIPDSTA